MSDGWVDMFAIGKTKENSLVVDIGQVLSVKFQYYFKSFCNVKAAWVVGNFEEALDLLFET